MQGDISPKNILCGPDGPVFLDAETACYGDPAFDLAFCLNHLLLKCIWHPEFVRVYLKCFAALKGAYLESASVAFQKKSEVDANYIKLLDRLLSPHQAGRFLAAIATHDPAIIAYARDCVRPSDTPNFSSGSR